MGHNWLGLHVSRSYLLAHNSTICPKHLKKGPEWPKICASWLQRGPNPEWAIFWAALLKN